MEIFQHAQNPWGQDVLVRISWDLFWLALVAGALFVLGHLVVRARQRGRGAASAAADTAVERPVEGIPERVVRHSLASRLFHWVMAVAMLVLLITGFLPQLGLKFSWVTIHWIAGLVLIASIVFHMIHATFFQRLRNIWISPRDVREWWQEMRHTFNSSQPPAPKPGKYPVDHKLFHHAAVLTGFGAMITGIFMLFRIDMPFLERDPYMFSDPSWGLIYVIHGLAGVGLVGLIVAHVYFAILPEKRWLTMSMIFGWITRKKYLQNHDPQRWTPPASRD